MRDRYDTRQWDESRRSGWNDWDDRGREDYGSGGYGQQGWNRSTPSDDDYSQGYQGRQGYYQAGGYQGGGYQGSYQGGQGRQGYGGSRQSMQGGYSGQGQDTGRRFEGRRGHGGYQEYDRADEYGQGRQYGGGQGGYYGGQGGGYGQGQGTGYYDVYATWWTSGEHTGAGPKGYQRSDERIREDVSERLQQSGGIDAHEIEVAVDGGVVSLKGTVPDRSMKRMAEDAVDSCSGVKDVHNELRVESHEHDQNGGSTGHSGQSGQTSQTGGSRQSGQSPSMSGR